MTFKLSILLGGVLTLCSLQAFAIDNCSSEKYFQNDISIPFNKTTTVSLGGLGSFQCFTVKVPTGVSNVQFESSSASITMAVKAGGYPDIAKVGPYSIDDFNDCSIRTSMNDCTVSSAKSGLYRGVIQPSFGATNQDMTFTVSAVNSSATNEPTSFCTDDPYDKKSYTNEVKVSSGDQPIGKIGKNNFTCFKFAVPKSDFTIKVHPRSAEGVSTLYVGKIGALPATYKSDRNACTIDVPEHTSCTIEHTDQSGDDGYYYMAYQNNGSTFKKGGTIAIELDETNFSQ